MSRFYSLLFLIVLFLGGCVKRELVIEEGERVRIAFDWSKILDPSAVPEGMQLWFYGADNIRLSRQASSTGFEGVLPDGNYRVIIYNPNAAGVGFRNMDRFETGEVYALEQADGMLTQLYRVYGLSIAEFTVKSGQKTDTTVMPVNYERQLIIQVRIEGEQQVIKNIGLTINGIASGANLATGDRNGREKYSVESQSMRFVNPYYKETFTLFGWDKQNPADVMLKIEMSDGSERTMRQNITQALQLLNEHPRTEPLLVEFTLGVTNVDGVFVATLEDWTYEDNKVVIN